MKVMEIQLSELTQKALTRTRGTEAVESLHARLKDVRPRRVVVCLSGLSLISGSFVDELAVKCKKIQEHSNVEIIYRVKDESILKKLARAAGLHGLELKYFWNDSAEILNVDPFRPRDTPMVDEKVLPENEPGNVAS